MNQVSSHGYIQGLPWVKVQYTLQTGTAPVPPTPPAPPVYFSISGTVTDSGSGYVAGLEFPGIGTIFSDAAGSYFQPVISGYSGVVVPHAADGTFAPASRTYTNVAADFTVQDYAHGTASPIPPPPEVFFLISGTVTDAGTGFSAAIEFTGTGTLTSDVSGSYGLLVGQGYSGTGLPHLAGGAFTPQFRVYSSTGSDMPNEDYDFNHTPVAFAQTVFVQEGSSVSIILSGSDYENLGLVCSAVTLPGSGQLTHGGAYTPDNGFTGTDSYLFACTDTGANPLTSPLAQVTIIVTPAVVPLDCPVPGANQIIALTPSVQLTRNVVDPVNKLLWILDDQSPAVRYVDLIGGTYAGSVTVPSPSQPGCAAIVYDTTTQKLVVTTYEGSVAFIDPATKAVTFSNVFSFDNFDFHTLAVQNGTAYMCPARTTNGRLWQVDCATELVTASWPLTPPDILTDSIAWADNIGRLICMQSEPDTNWFWVFDPATGVFTPSGQQSTTSFNYENFYIKATGHMLMSRDGSSRVEVVDISLGASGSTIATLDFNGGPNRIADATEDTCHDRLFVAAGQYVYEFSDDGSYTPLFFHDSDGNFGNLNNVGLSHSRATNLVYYENYNTNTVHTLQAVTTGGSIGGMAWTLSPHINTPWAGGTLAFAGGDGQFSGSSVGDEVNFSKQFNFDATTSLLDLDGPYYAEMKTVYTGSINDTGIIQQTSTFDIFQQMGAITDDATQNTNGVFSGTLVCTGTINGNTGFEVFVNAQTGGNLISLPCNTFVAVTGTTTIRPLTPP